MRLNSWSPQTAGHTLRRLQMEIGTQQGETIMEMIKCSDCGKEISGAAKMCPHCGRTRMAMVKCLGCGKEISGAASKCPHCGKKRTTRTAAIVAFTAIIIIGILLWFFW